jgi:hypothetical protein
MKIKLIILLLTITNIYAQDSRPFAFISAGGDTIRQAEVRAYNIAYMNNLKVVSFHTSKSGSGWNSIVKVVPK